MHPKTRPGGHVIFNTGEKITSADLNEVGTMGLQSLYNGVLARLLQDDVDGDPKEGFAGNDCLVTVSSGLTLEVAAGVGLYYDTAATDEFGLIYRPIVVDAAFQVTLDPHEADPRIDVVSLAPATEDDEQESRSVKDPDAGTVSTQSVYKRRRLSYSVTVTKGTAAASPTPPSTPSGHLKIAEARVPATAGAVTLDD